MAPFAFACGMSITTFTFHNCSLLNIRLSVIVQLKFEHKTLNIYISYTYSFWQRCCISYYRWTCQQKESIFAG